MSEEARGTAAAVTLAASGAAASGAVTEPVEAVPARRRARRAVPLEGVVRGAPDDVLAQPAAAFLEGVPWRGPSPDPDLLDAVTFLAWL